MRKTIILTYVILFIISPTVQSKSHSEDISYTDIIGICINGINNIKALKKDYEFLGARELPKDSYFYKEFASYGYEGRAIRNKTQEIFIVYYGSRENYNLCGAISENQNYKEVADILKSSFPLKIEDKKTRMGPKEVTFYKIKHYFSNKCFLNFEQSTGDTQGQIKVDVICDMK